MPRSVHNDDLDNIVTTLLNSDHPGELLASANELFQLFTSITSLNTQSITPVQLVTGRAISPIEAARCVLDFQRTTQFLRGIQLAIMKLQSRTNKPVEILYAGCGPFAPFAAMLATQFPYEQIRFSLIDIHAESIELAKHLFQQLGFDKHVNEFVQTDIATYSFQRDFDLIILETMQSALSKEPQLVNTWNLCQQLKAEGIFIPEKIQVTASLYDSSTEFNFSPAGANSYSSSRVRRDLGTLLTLTSSSRRTTESEFLEPVTIQIPVDASNPGLMIRTRLNIFDNIVLGDYDSGITSPVIVQDFANHKSESTIQFQYSFGREPGFRYRWGDSDWRNL